jgi:glutamyl-tRNA reductase
MNKQQLKNMIREEIKSTINEGKGADLARKTIADLRKKFKGLSNEELEEFMKDLSYAFDLKPL